MLFNSFWGGLSLYPKGQVQTKNLSDTKEENYMIEGTKKTNEKVNTLSEFTLMFWQNYLLMDTTKLPLGECVAAVLNLSGDTLLLMNDSRNALIGAMQNITNPRIKKDLATVTDLQNKLNKVLDLIISLPPFSYLINKDFGHSMLADIWSSQPKGFMAMMDRGTHEGEVFHHFIFKLISIIDETIAFKKYVSVMLDYYFEQLNKRNPEHYAVGVYSFFTDTKLINDIRATMPPIPSFDFAQTRHVGMEYAPMRNPNNEKEYIIAERIEFDSMGAFLHADFFRALINGHCPRKCHNCGIYFLLLSGHNTCYCSNIAPNQNKKGDTKTCRDIGAHVKEAEKKENRTPTQQEYDKVYNRLKTRKNRGKLSIDDWNNQVADAVSYMEQNQKGELSDFDYREIMKKF